MSKAKLRKELSTFTAEQLADLIASVYDVSKEAKSYLEFFLEPDAEALYKKKITAISKEIDRTRRGRIAKARISLIKSEIKSFIAYGVGYEYAARLYSDTLRMLIGMERYIYFPPTLLNGVRTLVRDYLTYASKQNMASDALARLSNEVNDPDIGRPYFREKVKEWVDISLAEIN